MSEPAAFPLQKTLYTTSNHSNGVRAVVAEMPFMESVSLGIWAGVGSRYEPAKINGITHFVEHMVFKGTQNRTARQLTTEVEAAGGRIDAYTMADQTCYYIKGPAERFPRFLDVLADLYQNAIFPAEEVDREREVIREEIVMCREQPSQHVEDLLGLVAWPDSSLGRPITGTEKSIAHISRDDLIAHASDHYCAPQTVVSVAGQVSSKEVFAILEEKFASLSANACKKPAVQEPALPDKMRMLCDHRQSEQVQLALGFPCGGRFDQHYLALKLLHVLLGGSMSSRLWQKLREDRGLCYEVQTELLTLDDTGLFQVYAGVDASNVEESLRLILTEIRDLAANGPQKLELQEAFQYAAGTQRVTLEDTASQMTWAGESLLSYGKVIDPAAALEALSLITPENIREAAAASFSPNNLAAAFVGNARETPALRGILENW